MEEDKFLKAIEGYVKDNPQQIKPIITILAKSLYEYEEKIKNERNSIAWNGFWFIKPFLFSSAKLKRYKNKVSILIDMFFFLYPTGKPSQEDEDFNSFLKLCIYEEYLTKHIEWLKNIKGEQYYIWLKTAIDNFQKET